MDFPLASNFGGYLVLKETKAEGAVWAGSQEGPPHLLGKLPLPLWAKEVGQRSV